MAALHSVGILDWGPADGASFVARLTGLLVFSDAGLGFDLGFAVEPLLEELLGVPFEVLQD